MPGVKSELCPLELKILIKNCTRDRHCKGFDEYRRIATPTYPRCYLISPSSTNDINISRLVRDHLFRRSPQNLGHEPVSFPALPRVLGISRIGTTSLLTVEPRPRHPDKLPSGRIWSHTQKGKCVRCTNAAYLRTQANRQERGLHTRLLLYIACQGWLSLSQLTRSTLHEFLSSTLFTYQTTRTGFP